MFVLPPPPRYPSQVAYAAAAANGMPVPAIETNNILKHPEGPEFQFQVGEGTYKLRDDLHLATPPPHPSEAPVQNPNPLSTNPTPPTSGVKLSIVSLLPRKSALQLSKVSTNSSDRQTYSIQESEKEGRPSAEGSDSGKPPSSVDESGSAPAFGEGNTALAQATGKDTLKRRKPKTNIVKSNSSFVSRVIPHEGLTRRLSERDPYGLFAFANINRALQWLDLSSNVKEEPMAKILFTKAHMLCHDINRYTVSPSHVDLILGSSAGDIIWYEPMSQKYARLNKNGAINSTPVAEIKWIPGSENLFLASHMDGTLIVYDKEKEDAPFLAEEAMQNGGHHEKNGSTDLDATLLNVTKSVNSKNQKANPVACWKISNQPINQFAFSPDSRHLAVVSEDGCLRIIDYLKEKLTDIYTSYYGGLICCSWSPDGKYVVTGGQDDLVSIWSLADRSIVARCTGHASWVTAVAFDPWRCDEKGKNYRFGSVGEDCKLLLWDFSVGMLHRPRGVTARPRGSVSSVPLSRLRTESSTIAHRLRSDSDSVAPNGGEIQHPVEPRARTAQLPPVMAKTVDDHPLCWLSFQEDSILTSCWEGHIRSWGRPMGDGEVDGLGSEKKDEHEEVERTTTTTSSTTQATATASGSNAIITNGEAGEGQGKTG